MPIDIVEDVSSPAVKESVLHLEEASKKLLEKRNRTKRENIKCFIDTIGEEDCIKMNEVLLEFFIACDINFKCIESKYLKNLIQFLRPAFVAKLPSTRTLSQDVLSQVYDKHMNSKRKFDSCGVLL